MHHRAAHSGPAVGIVSNATDEQWEGFVVERRGESLLAGITSASVLGLVATGHRAGRRVRRVLSDPSEAVRTGSL